MDKESFTIWVIAHLMAHGPEIAYNLHWDWINLGNPSPGAYTFTKILQALEEEGILITIRSGGDTLYYLDDE